MRAEENGRLEDQLETTREYVDLSSEYAVTDRLTDVPVLVAAARGVDEAAVERTRGPRSASRRASCRGSSGWSRGGRPTGDEDLEALAAIVGGSATDAREDLWADGVGGRHRRAGRPGADGPTHGGDAGASIAGRSSRRPGSSPSTRSTTRRWAWPT